MQGYRRRGFFLRRRRQTKRFLLIILPAILCGTLLFAGLVYVVNLDVFMLRDIGVFGGSEADHAIVRVVVNEILGGFSLGFISKRNTFFISQKHLSEALGERLFHVADISVSRRGFTDLRITLTPRVGVAEWCPSESSGRPQCYLVDRDGIAFATSTGETPITLFGLITAPQPIRESYLSRDRFYTLRSVLDGLRGLEISPRAVVASSADDVSIVLPDEARVMLDVNHSAAAALAALQAVIAERTLSVERGTFAPAVEYVDLRFRNKVIYRLRSHSSSPAGGI